MDLIFNKQEERPYLVSGIYIIYQVSDLDKSQFTDKEFDFIKTQIEEGEKQVAINQYHKWGYIFLDDEKKPLDQACEDLRKAACKIYKLIKQNKHKNIHILDFTSSKVRILACAEGLALTHYQFSKYLKKTDHKNQDLKKISLYSSLVTQEDIDELQAITDAVYTCRDLVNEPVSHLTAVQLAAEFEKMAEEAGFNIEVFDRKKIESLRMGGLLAVNRGSLDPPTFTVMEWKPKNAINSQPIVLVGKGVVFDTGGLSLKPTKDSMDFMKSDMAGAAAVAGAMYVAARLNFPLHLVALVPATDNRPGGNAYVPGDIIKMHNGLTVEVLNCDAEGRLILADALSYAQQYKPEFVIELSTLTGAASVAIGKYGLVAMGNAGNRLMELLKQAGEKTHERIVEFPFWDEYKELIKSDIADLKNTGGKDAGAITAGKFLEHFTNYPYIHLDIAGPSFVSSTDSYHGKGGTGVGVRLITQFLKNYMNNPQNA